MSERGDWRDAARETLLQYCLVREPFTTAAGVSANLKVELDNLRETSRFFRRAVAAIGEWAVSHGVTALSGVPTGGVRFAEAAAWERELPFIPAGKCAGKFAIGGITDLEGPVGIVDDVRSTGSSMLEFAKLFGGVPVQGLVVVDRGLRVDGVRTLEQSQAYSGQHPEAPPAHIRLPFSCKALVEFPLNLYAPD